MSNASELLSKSSYCRNSKHTKCKTAECGCKCHAEAVSPEPVNRVEELHPDDTAEGQQLTGEVGQKFEVTIPETDPIKNSLPRDAAQVIADRLDPAKAPAPKPAKVKAPKEPKPVVKGTVDGKLSNTHKRAIRIQMVAYLNAMPVDLQGDLEGVTPEEAAAYVDTYWVKYIDPARDKARHAK